MNTKNFLSDADSGATSTEASSTATSTQSSANKDKATLKSKFVEVPSGITILADGIVVDAGLVVARNVSKEDFLELAESNPHLTKLFLLNGDVIFTEVTSHRVHNRLIFTFQTLVDTYNRSNEHQIRLRLDSDTLVPYNIRTVLAADIMISNRARLSSGIRAPNIVGEIGYSTKLSTLISLAPNYLSDVPDNHTELYFIVKLSYPYSIAHPDHFQMVFILYDRQHLPAPVSIVSCGTLPVSEAVQGHITNLTGISVQTHPDRHRGHGYGGLPCSWANRGHADYTVTLGGARIMSINRDAELPPEVADPDMYAFDISLFEMQAVVSEALLDMNAVTEGHTAVSQAEFEAQLHLAAGDGGGVGGGAAAEVGGGEKAAAGGGAALLTLDHLRV